MHDVVLRYDDQAAGHLIEAVNDAGPLLTAHAAQFAEVAEQSIRLFMQQVAPEFRSNAA